MRIKAAQILSLVMVLCLGLITFPIIANAATSNCKMIFHVASDASPTPESAVSVAAGQKVYLYLYIDNTVVSGVDETGTSYIDLNISYDNTLFSITQGTDSTDFTAGTDAPSAFVLESFQDNSGVLRIMYGDPNNLKSVVTTNSEKQMLKLTFTAKAAGTCTFGYDGTLYNCLTSKYPYSYGGDGASYGNDFSVTYVTAAATVTTNYTPFSVTAAIQGSTNTGVGCIIKAYATTDTGFQTVLDSAAVASDGTVTFSSLDKSTSYVFVMKPDKCLSIKLTGSYISLSAKLDFTSGGTQQFFKGDMNSDDAINVNDLSIFVTDYASTITAADLNEDSGISVSDLSIFVANYGKTGDAYIA